MSPKDVNDMYVSRTAFEKQYKAVKTNLGYGQVRVHYISAVYAKFTAGFIASVMRDAIQKASTWLGRTATQMIHEMNLLKMTKVNGTFVYSHVENTQAVTMLRHLGSNISLFDEITEDKNDRLAGRHPMPRHRKPDPQEKSQKDENRYRCKQEKATSKTGIYSWQI